MQQKTIKRKPLIQRPNNDKKKKKIKIKWTYKEGGQKPNQVELTP